MVFFFSSYDKEPEHRCSFVEIEEALTTLIGRHVDRDMPHNHASYLSSSQLSSFQGQSAYLSGEPSPIDGTVLLGASSFARVGSDTVTLRRDSETLYSRYAAVSAGSPPIQDECIVMTPTKICVTPAASDGVALSYVPTMSSQPSPQLQTLPMSPRPSIVSAVAASEYFRLADMNASAARIIREASSMPPAPDAPSLRGSESHTDRGSDIPSCRASELATSYRGSDVPSFRGSEAPSFLASDIPSLRGSTALSNRGSAALSNRGSDAARGSDSCPRGFDGASSTLPHSRRVSRPSFIDPSSQQACVKTIIHRPFLTAGVCRDHHSST